MSKKCSGCGVILQTKDATLPGFYIDKGEDKHIYCKRCFRLKHYHEYKIDTLEFSNDELLEKAEQVKAPIFFFVDFLQLSEEAIYWFKKIRGEKYFVITKSDIIPNSISFFRLKERIANIYEIDTPIFFLSSKNRKLMATLMNFMKNNQMKKVLFLGMTNAGKSTFLNQLAKEYNQEETDIIESEMPNTTLDFIKWNVNELMIIDAPGFNYQFQYLESDFIQKNQVSKYLKPVTLPLKKETGVQLDNICYFEQNLDLNWTTFYGSEKFDLKKVYQVPFIYQDKNCLLIEIPEYSDFVIKGVGFFSFKQMTTLKVYGLSFEQIEVRPSFFGGKHDTD